MFATGIECSYPTVPDGNGGRRRVDELEKCGHYGNWKQDFQLVKEMGLDYLRFGGPYYRIHTGPGQYDWSWLDEPLGMLKDLGITPILDLCHFGVPDWIGDFQNQDWPHFFAEFASEVARRYDWVELFTPVNEIFVAALFSGRYGYWNEALTSQEGFVRALTNLCKANVMAMNSIVETKRDHVRFVQSESSRFYHAKEPCHSADAHFHNEQRFLALDLSYAYPVTAQMYRYLLDNGMRQEEFDWFQKQSVKARCIMGNDYYERNEQGVDTLPKPGTAPKPEGPKDHDREESLTLGYYAVAKQYFERYHLPIMHTETNMKEPRAVHWLWQNWIGLYRLHQDHIPIMGFTWYSLIDQVDWDTALTQDLGHDDPLGLFDLNRKIRPVGKEYKKLIQDWKGALDFNHTGLSQSRW